MSEDKKETENIFFIERRITAGTAECFVEYLKKLKVEFDSPDFILNINSKGDCWDACKTICCAIDQYYGSAIGVATENCSSVAFIILQKCKKRSAYEKSNIVIHEVCMTKFPCHRITADFLDQIISRKKNETIRNISNDLKKCNQEMVQFLSEISGMEIKEIQEIMKNEDYSDKEYLLKNNFIDIIIKAF